MKLSDVKTVEKYLDKEKHYCNDWGGCVRCKDSITIKKAQDSLRVEKEE
jgi:hypothetical protein